jgi:hypothetical protein
LSVGWIGLGIKQGVGAIAVLWGAAQLVPSAGAIATLPTIVSAPASLQPAAPALSPSDFPTLNSGQFDQQLQRYLRFLAESGPPDILIVGSSRASWGVDPIVLQRALVKRGHSNLKVFNFGVNGATAKVVEWLLRDLLTPEQLPRLIVWADGVRAFNSGRLDTTYDNLAVSEGYQAIAAGIRPPLLPPAQLRLGQFCLEMPPSYANSWASSSLSFPGGLAASTAPLRSESLPCLGRVRLFRRFDPPPQPTADTLAALHEATGFLAKSEKFDPDTYFQRYPLVPGGYDADYRNFSLVAEQTIALENVLRYAATRKIPVVFVSLPLTQFYLDSVRADSEEQFRIFLHQLAIAKRMTVLDWSGVWSGRYDYFVDPSHLNRFGAEAVALELGRVLVLPP